MGGGSVVAGSVVAGSVVVVFGSVVVSVVVVSEVVAVGSWGGSTSAVGLTVQFPANISSEKSRMTCECCCTRKC